MKRICIVWILLMFQYLIKAQTDCVVCDVFNQIKLENIDNKLKDSILTHTKYYPQTNDSDYIEYYSLTIDSVKEQVRIEFGFESGQKAYAIDEIKLFKKSDGNYKAIYSHCTGANAMLNQGELSIYDYNTKTRILSIDNLTRSLFQIGLKDFFKVNTPDSVITEFDSHSGFSYDLFYAEKNDIEFRLVNFLIFDHLKDNKDVSGNIIGFKWINDRFVRLEPYFEE